MLSFFNLSSTEEAQQRVTVSNEATHTTEEKANHADEFWDTFIFKDRGPEAKEKAKFEQKD
jgi:hypothetical protein